MPTIHVTDEYFIEVNEEGFVSNDWAEGALGFVIRMKSKTGGPDRAVKIPRLLADTLEENAHINYLLAEERRVAFKVGPENGLLNAYNSKSPFKGLQTVAAGQQKDGIILMCCSKDEPPRLCWLKFENEKLSMKPKIPVIEEVFNPKQTTPDEDQREEQDQLEARNQVEAQDQEKQSSFFARLRSDSDEFSELAAFQESKSDSNETFAIGQKLSERESRYWYVGFEGIIYDWANGTLQELVAKRKLNLNFRNRLLLVNKIVKAIEHLHGHKDKLMHGDLRPANIMFVNRGEMAADFLVTDYGSFGHEQANYDDAMPPNTMGASVHRQRTSPFYSPERSSGDEKELADVALLFSDNKNVTVVLGWKNDLIDKGECKSWEDLKKELKLDAKQNVSGSVPFDEIKAGDILRIREYMLTATESNTTKNGQLLVHCKPKVGIIRHDKFITPLTEKLPSKKWLSIPRTVIFRKWAAPVDVYAIGALTIYLNFCSTSFEELYPDGEQRNDDESFKEMMERLQSRAYFQDVWKRIERLRNLVDAIYDSKLGQTVVPESKVSEFMKGDVLYFNKEYSVIRCLKDEVSYITRTTPGLIWILKACEFNYAKFIYLFHFSLSCLHRRDSLLKSDIRGSDVFPFCSSRMDTVNSNGPMSKVLRYINHEIEDSLINRVNADVFKELVLDPSTDPSAIISGFAHDTEKSEYKTRLQNLQYEKSLREVNEYAWTKHILLSWLRLPWFMRNSTVKSIFDKNLKDYQDEDAIETDENQ